MKKILIVEDDPKIRRYLELELKYEGYSVDLAENGVEGLKKAKENYYNLILLDLMMPKMSGEDVCGEIRKESNVPILVITAKDKTFSKINLLDLGADDYITKPFEIGELLARMRVAFRNKGEYSEGSKLTYGSLEVDLEKKLVYSGKEEVPLTKTEYNLLHYLLLNKGIVLSREQILTNIWGYDYLGGEKIVDVYINTLRKKIDKDKNSVIKTVRGFGYSIKEVK